MRTKKELEDKIEELKARNAFLEDFYDEQMRRKEDIKQEQNKERNKMYD